MRFALSFVVAAIIVGPLIGLPKRKRILVYSAAILSQFVYLLGMYLGWHGAVWAAFAVQMQRCTLAFVLFSIVMFMGVLSESSRIRNRLAPIRQQLSILACVFTFGHIGYYLPSYLLRIGSINKVTIGISLALSILLAIMLIVLLATSLSLVKKHMNGTAWKRVQRLAYPFYLLISLHAACFLLPSALAGNAIAIEGELLYGCSAIAFFALRLRRAFFSRRTEKPFFDAQDALVQDSR